MFLLGFASEVRSGLNGDSAWLLYVAGRVLDGARLYVDVVEVNPPLVVWLNLPIVALARLGGMPEAWAYRGFVWGTALLSLWLADRMLRRLSPPPASWRRGALLVALVVVLLGIPGAYFGQREHLALLLLLPWLFAGAARAGGSGPAPAEAAAIGALAAIGVALKPHYLLLPAGVIAYQLALAPRGRRRVEPEHAALAAVLVAYALLALLLAPEYLTLASRFGGVYWDYLRRPLRRVLAGDLLPLTVLGSVLFWPLARRLTGHPRLVDVLGIATVTLFASVVLQHKGFGYHYYPALGTGLLLVSLGLMGGGERRPGVAVSIAAQGVGLLVLLPIVALFTWSVVARAGGSARRGHVAAGSREIAAFLEARSPTGAVVIYSPWMEDSFPLVLEQKAAWGSRYPFMWFLPALHRERLRRRGPVTCRPEAELPEAGRELLGTVAEDLRHYRPELIFVRKPLSRGLLRMDLLACFSQVSGLRRELSAYRPLLDLGYFRVFQRRTDQEH